MFHWNENIQSSCQRVNLYVNIWDPKVWNSVVFEAFLLADRLSLEPDGSHYELQWTEAHEITCIWHHTVLNQFGWPVLKKTNFFTGKTFYTSTIKTYCPKGFYLNGHMQMVFVHRVNTSWEIAELTKQIFISNDMDTEISDRLKYFDNLCNGNNLQVNVNAMMCSKLTELLEVTVHCR